MQKTYVLSSSILALGIVLGGFMVARGFVEFKKADNAIDVRGLSERLVKSDKGSLQLAFTVTGNDLKSLYPEVSRSQKEIVVYLKTFGFEEADIQKGQVALSDNNANSYSNSRGPRYIARSSVSLMTTKVQEVIKAAEDAQNLLQKGVTVEGVTKHFYFTDLNSIKPEMLKEATQNAREAAQSLAADSKVKLGVLKNASQGLFSIEDPLGNYDDSVSVTKKVRVVTQTTFAIE